MTNTRRAPRPGLARSRRRNRACSAERDGPDLVVVDPNAVQHRAPRLMSDRIALQHATGPTVGDLGPFSRPGGAEAMPGKNPVGHVGKICGMFTFALAETLIRRALQTGERQIP